MNKRQRKKAGLPVKPVTRTLRLRRNRAAIRAMRKFRYIEGPAYEPIEMGLSAWFSEFQQEPPE